MTEMMYFMVGAGIAGVIIGVLITFLIPYQALRSRYAQLQIELAESQAQGHDLHSSVLAEQSKAYQERQVLLTQQKRLENDLVDAGERYTSLEQEFATFRSRGEQQLEAQDREIKQLHETVAQRDQEKSALIEQQAQKAEEWREERQGLTLLNSQMDDELRGLRREKTQFTSNLEQQQDTWERERLALQIQLNLLEEQMSAQPNAGAASSGAVHAGGSEKLHNEIAALHEQQRAWAEERQSLQGQLERLQAERRALRDDVAVYASAAGDDAVQQLQALREQLASAQQASADLQRQITAQTTQSAQERTALEAEIEQLMERIMRMQSAPSS